MLNIKISDSKDKCINPEMIGLFFEDINYAADGGLYAEMIENRMFAFVKTAGPYADYYTVPAGDYAWNMASSESGEFNIVSGSPLALENPNYMRVTVKKPGFYVTNKAYEGVTLKKGVKGKVLIWARFVKYEGNLTVSLEKDGKDYFEKSVSKDSFIDEKYNFWKLFSFDIDITEDIEKATFKLSFDSEGTVELAYVSLIPDTAVMGIFRHDLFNLLNELHPGFIRFPGGCIIEGNTLANRYDYKNTLKPTWNRKSNWNRWAVHGGSEENNFTTDYAWYNQTLGLGFYEYFLLCEALQAKALPVLNVGLACQYQSHELVAIDSEDFKQFIQDALDLIEFANGDVNSTWGSVRKKMGHEEPFNLEFLGIGNEQWQTEKVDFFERYVEFEKAIHAKYPDIKLIGSAGPDITSERYTAAWDFYRKNKHVDNFAYALDEHYYVKPEWLFEHNTFYDDYNRDIKVFSGEYAAHPCSGFNMPEANTLYGALSEAAFMTGVERNADVVVLASYAPLFARVNYTQWSPDMIWFNDSIAYGSPSYHVQKMYANNMGDQTLKVENLDDARNAGIYYSLSKDSKSGERILKIVNSTEKEVELSLDIEGETKEKVKVTTLTGSNKDSYNFVDAPDRVTTTDYILDSIKSLVLPSLSFSVYRF